MEPTSLEWIDDIESYLSKIRVLAEQMTEYADGAALCKEKIQNLEKMLRAALGCIDYDSLTVGRAFAIAGYELPCTPDRLIYDGGSWTAYKNGQIIFTYVHGVSQNSIVPGWYSTDGVQMSPDVVDYWNEKHKGLEDDSMKFAKNFRMPTSVVERLREFGLYVDNEHNPMSKPLKRNEKQTV